jgi:MOSC domain-containing protein YiiM
MQVLSLNISKPTSIIINGKKEITGYFKTPVHDPIFLGKTDVKNDTVVDRIHHGGEEKACYLYGYNHYPFWKTNYPALPFTYGMFGENITLKTLDETQICIGDTFQLGDAVIQVSQPRQPCYKMGVKFNDNTIMDTFRSLTYSGMYVRVLQEGLVKKEDSLNFIERQNKPQTIAEIFQLIYSNKPEQSVLENALANPFLPLRLKDYLRNKFKK